MADHYTEVTNTGYFWRIWKSLKGVLIWILLFFLSFFVLYRNEGKVNLADVARTSTTITAKSENLADLQDKLVSVSGILKTDNEIWDIYLKPGKYISIDRQTQMYAWVETTREETEKNLWGSETTTTTYDYNTKWVESPESSSSFKYPSWHTNPEKSIESTSIIAGDLQTEGFSLNKNIELPVWTELTLTEENIILQEWIKQEWNYLYKPYNSISTYSSPSVWDVRVSYAVLENPLKNTTTFWKLENKDTISAFVWPKDSKLYRVLEWNREEAIATLQYEHDMLTWILRWVWFFMMFMGLVWILTPLSVVLDVIPFVGTFWEWAIKVVSFVVAFVLSLITIIISMIIHNIWALIIVILLAITGIFYLWKKKKALPVNNESVEK